MLGRARVSRFLATIVFLGAIFGLWAVVKLVFAFPDYILPGPADVVTTGAAEYRRLGEELQITATGAFGGFLIGNLAGFLGAVAVALSVSASRVILPMALIVRVIPIIALTPFLTLLLGRGLATVTAISALIVFFPTLINGVLGLRSIDRETLELMSVMNASPWQVFWRARLPAALPHLFAALRIAAPASVLGAMVAEWVASGSGLGYLILQASVTFQVELMWSAVLLATALALAAFTVTAWAERVLLAWHPQE